MTALLEERLNHNVLKLIGDAIPKQTIKIEPAWNAQPHNCRGGNKTTQVTPVGQKGSLITQVALKIPIRTDGCRPRQIVGGP